MSQMAADIKKLDSEIVIGNYLIESISSDKYNFTIDEINEFSGRMNEQLNQKSIPIQIIPPSGMEIKQFEILYRSLISCNEDNSIHIKISCKKTGNACKKSTIELLKTYFRCGLPTTLINSFAVAYSGEVGQDS